MLSGRPSRVRMYSDVVGELKLTVLTTILTTRVRCKRVNQLGGVQSVIVVLVRIGGRNNRLYRVNHYSCI
jgi:hypothetical protein